MQIKILVVIDNSIGHYRREIFSRYTSNGLETKILRTFWTFYIKGMNVSSFQAMEPKNEPS